MTRRFVFVGPSLSDPERAVTSAGYTWLPPVAAGDLIGLDLRPGDVVGIVDGYFHQRRAVRHKEILHLLERSVQVLGAASIGALRAAELDTFGMSGVGGIYADYRDGRLVADDEVALLHGTESDGYRPLSVPLVNIRATVRRAVDLGVIDPGVGAACIQELGAMPYRRRNYDTLARLAEAHGMPPDAGRRLRSYCLEHGTDRKQADALALLEAMGRSSDTEVAPPIVHATTYLRTWQSRPELVDGLRVCQVLAADFPAAYRASTWRWIGDECRQMCHRADAAIGPLAQAVVHGIHRGVYADPSDLTFLHAWTTPTERIDLSQHELIGRFLARTYRIGPGISPHDNTIAWLSADHPAALAQAVSYATRARELNDLGARYRDDFAAEQLSGEVVAAWLCGRWNIDRAELPLAAFDRGFDGPGSLIHAARPLFLLGRCEPAIEDFTLRPS